MSQQQMDLGTIAERLLILMSPPLDTANLMAWRHAWRPKVLASLREVASAIASRSCSCICHEDGIASQVALSEARAEIERLKRTTIDFKWYDAAVTALEDRNAELSNLRQHVAERERAAFNAGLAGYTVPSDSRDGIESNKWVWRFDHAWAGSDLDEAWTAYQLQQAQQPKDGDGR